MNRTDNYMENELGSGRMNLGSGARNDPTGVPVVTWSRKSSPTPEGARPTHRESLPRALLGFSLICLSWLALLPSAAASSSAPTEKQTSEPTEVVVVATAEHGEEVAMLLGAALDAQVRPIRVRTDSHAPELASGSIVLLLDTDDSTNWRLVLRYRGERYTRAMGTGIERDAALVEAVAAIASRAIRALLERQHGAEVELSEWTREAKRTEPVTPTETRDPAMDVPAPPPTNRIPLREAALVFAAARVQPYAAGEAWQWGASLGVSWRSQSGLGITVAGSYFPAPTQQRELGDYRIQRYPVELLGEWTLGNADWSVGPRIGVLWEGTTRFDTRTEPAIASVPERFHSRWALVAGASGAVSVASHGELFVAPSLEYFLRSFEFSDQAGGSGGTRLIRVRGRFECGARWVF